MQTQSTAWVLNLRGQWESITHHIISLAFDKSEGWWKIWQALYKADQYFLFSRLRSATIHQLRGSVSQIQHERESQTGPYVKAKWEGKNKWKKAGRRRLRSGTASSSTWSSFWTEHGAHEAGKASGQAPRVHPAPAQPYQSRAPRHCQPPQRLWEAQVAGARLNPTRTPRREPWDQGQFQQALPPSEICAGTRQAPGDGEAQALGPRVADATEQLGLASWVPSYPWGLESWQ